MITRVEQVTSIKSYNSSSCGAKSYSSLHCKDVGFPIKQQNKNKRNVALAKFQLGKQIVKYITTS